MEPKARPGQILANDVVRQLLGNRGGFVCTPAGEYELKGFTEPLACCDIAGSPTRACSKCRCPPGSVEVRCELAGRDRGDGDAAEPVGVRGRRGGSAAVVVTGEPGEGKTRLASELAAVAHGAGATVLYGRCDADSSRPGPTGRGGAAVVRRRVRARPAPRTGRRDSTSSSSLVPSLTARLPDLVAPVHDRPAAGCAERRASGFITRAAAANPMLLVLDDLQDASPATLELIAALAHRTAARPDAVALSRRDDELGDVAAIERLALAGCRSTVWPSWSADAGRAARGVGVDVDVIAAVVAARPAATPSTSSR